MQREKKRKQLANSEYYETTNKKVIVDSVFSGPTFLVSFGHFSFGILDELIDFSLDMLLSVIEWENRQEWDAVAKCTESRKVKSDWGRAAVVGSRISEQLDHPLGLSFGWYRVLSTLTPLIILNLDPPFFLIVDILSQLDDRCLWISRSSGRSGGNCAGDSLFLFGSKPIHLSKSCYACGFKEVMLFVRLESIFPPKETLYCTAEVDSFWFWSRNQQGENLSPRLFLQRRNRLPRRGLWSSPSRVVDGLYIEHYDFCL